MQNVLFLQEKIYIKLTSQINKLIDEYCKLQSSTFYFEITLLKQTMHL